jgi:hypothetical protein
MRTVGERRGQPATTNQSDLMEACRVMRGQWLNPYRGMQDLFAVTAISQSGSARVNS